MFCSVPVLAQSQIQIHGTGSPSPSPEPIFRNSYHLVLLSGLISSAASFDIYKALTRKMIPGTGQTPYEHSLW